MARIEEQYEDVLQNMEVAIVSVYREHREMSDYDVLRVLDAVVDSYRAENVGRAPRNFGLSEVEDLCRDRLRQICEWRLGRVSGPEGSEPEPKKVDEILLCLKRIVKSVKRWNREGGRQGYLDFVARFV